MNNPNISKFGSNDLKLHPQRTDTYGKPHGRNPNDLQFLNQHIVPGVPGHNPRSKSHFIGFNKGIVRAGSGTTAGMLRMRKNLYDQNKQIMRYKNLNKSGNLATRLNRPMPANTNFPDEEIRNKMTTGFETSTRFKLSEA